MLWIHEVPHFFGELKGEILTRLQRFQKFFEAGAQFGREAVAQVAE